MHSQTLKLTQTLSSHLNITINVTGKLKTKFIRFQSHFKIETETEIETKTTKTKTKNNTNKNTNTKTISKTESFSKTSKVDLNVRTFSTNACSTDSRIEIKTFERSALALNASQP